MTNRQTHEHKNHYSHGFPSSLCELLGKDKLIAHQAEFKDNIICLTGYGMKREFPVIIVSYTIRVTPSETSFTAIIGKTLTLQRTHSYINTLWDNATNKVCSSLEILIPSGAC